MKDQKHTWITIQPYRYFDITWPHLSLWQWFEFKICSYCRIFEFQTWARRGRNGAM